MWRSEYEREQRMSDFPSFSCIRRRRSGSLGAPSPVSRKFLVPLYQLDSNLMRGIWPCHLVVSLQDPPCPQFFFTSDFLQSPFLKKHYCNPCYPFLAGSFPAFLFSQLFRSNPHVVIVQLVFNPLGHRKTVGSPYHRKGGTRW